MLLHCCKSTKVWKGLFVDCCPSTVTYGTHINCHKLCTATDHVIFSWCIYISFHGNLLPLAWIWVVIPHSLFWASLDSGDCGDSLLAEPASGFLGVDSAWGVQTLHWPQLQTICASSIIRQSMHETNLLSFHNVKKHGSNMSSGPTFRTWYLPWMIFYHVMSWWSETLSSSWLTLHSFSEKLSWEIGRTEYPYLDASLACWFSRVVRGDIIIVIPCSNSIGRKNVRVFPEPVQAVITRSILHSRARHISSWKRHGEILYLERALVMMRSWSMWLFVIWALPEAPIMKRCV